MGCNHIAGWKPAFNPTTAYVRCPTCGAVYPETHLDVVRSKAKAGDLTAEQTGLGMLAGMADSDFVEKVKALSATEGWVWIWDDNSIGLVCGLVRVDRRKTAAVVVFVDDQDFDYDYDILA